MRGKRTLIVVPLFENPHLIVRIQDSLIAIADELQKLKAECLFVNDSPASLEVSDEISRAQQALLLKGIRTETLVNERNLGFVISANKGMERAIETESHCLLLNSDVILTAGCLSEMLSIFEEDPMIGFVTPRSNNATICSLPFETRFEKRSFEESLNVYNQLSRFLPRWSFLPTAVGFCLLIRSDILQEFGVFDLIYSPGYNEENDYCMRANRCGYRAAIANHAFAFHDLTSSFEKDDKIFYDERNRSVLLQRYSEYQKLIESYFESADFKFVRGLSAIVNRNKVYSWAVDLSHLGLLHTGTSAIGVLLLHALACAKTRDFRLSVIIQPQIAEFHGLRRLLPEVSEIAPISDKCYFDVVIKLAQPFQFADLENISKWGLYDFVLMLDTIAIDCGYLFCDELNSLWQLTARSLDGIIFISKFSQEQFNRRYPDGKCCRQLACLLSADEMDYLSDPRIHCYEVPSPKEEMACLPERPWIFVVGNHFFHKYVRQTIDALRTEFPDEIFVVLGGANAVDGNTRTIQAGGLHQKTMHALFEGAKVVIFPSHYEGFGFPIPEALAKNRCVMAREGRATSEIATAWRGGGHLEIFASTKDLVKKLRAQLSGQRFLDSATDKKQLVELPPWSWQSSAEMMIAFVKRTIAGDPELKKRRERISQLELVRPFESFQKRFQEVTNQSRHVQEKLNVIQEKLNVVQEELHFRNIAGLRYHGRQAVKAGVRAIKRRMSLKFLSY